MKSLVAYLLSAALLLPSLSVAQDRAQSMQESMDKAEGTLSAMTEFVGDVRFDEADVKHVIELWPEFEELGEKISDEIGEDEDSAPDFTAVLSEPGYKAWVKKHGLDGKGWLQRALRIQLLTAKGQYDAGDIPSNDQMDEQMKQLEKMRSQLGEKAYEQMVKTMKVASSAMSSMNESMNSLPQANEKEQALLDKYSEQLKDVMNQ